MIKSGSIIVGALVVDANPYKAPELMYGYGIVIAILDSKYATVHWTDYNAIQNVRMEDLELVSENR